MTYVMDAITQKIYTILYLHRGNLKNNTVRAIACTYSPGSLNRTTHLVSSLIDSRQHRFPHQTCRGP
jgi:hypothetical protein